MEDALDKNDAYVEAGSGAPEVATCPVCGGSVDLRSRFFDTDILISASICLLM
jgi:hypothetical protein